MTNSLASLPARPPTPPRDVSKDVDNALRFLREGHQDTAPDSSPANVNPSTDTPPNRSPASSQNRGSTNTKKVDFSPWPTYHKIPRPGQSSSPDSRASKQTPLRCENRPLKSILKPASEPLPPTPDDLESKLSYFSPQEPGSFRKMLQSVLSQLASPSRDDRRDAYLVLTGALKQYEGIPDPQAIIEKIELLQQFISRDIQWKDAEGRLDNNIVSQALTLTGFLLFNPHISEFFHDDFRAFLVDRSTAIIEQSDVSKAIVKNHMYLMAQQKFRSVIMTSARVERLVNAVQGIEDRCTGNSVVSARLLILLRLVDSAPNTMLHRMRDWIEHVFHGMLSSVDDIRTRAIDACSHAGLRLGSHPPAVKVLLEVLDKSVDDSENAQSYGDYFNFRLTQMTAVKELAPWVPRIWAAVTLFFRCKRKPLEKWPKIKEWLMTIQTCLNSADLEVKHQATIAWNKLVFSVMPDSATAESMRSMLKVPIVVALEKRGNDRLSQQQRQIAMDSYCNLLHYGLRPSLSHEEIDAAWNMYVDPTLTSMARSRGKGQYNACRILHGLLMKSNGVWNANAAIEPDAIKPEDLPRLDPRWVRTRLAKVLKILEPIFIAGMWTMPQLNNAADSCWRLLLQALAEAGSQEVKTSNELKTAIAQITNLFRRIWSAQSPKATEADSSIWMHRYQSLLEQAIESLGPSHFIEDILTKTEANEIEAVPTPSHRHSKEAPSVYPPFVFLFALYYQPRIEIRESGLYRKSAAWFLRVLGRSKATTSASIGLMLRSLEFASDQQMDLDVAGQVWVAVGEAAMDAMKVTAPASSRDAQIMGAALLSAISILVDGLRHAEDPRARTTAENLYATICQCAKHYGHDGGIALGVMEPLSKRLLPKLDEMPLLTALTVGQAFMENGVWPKNRQELEQSRKALYAVSLELRKTPTFDPFEYAYGLFVGIMDRAYKSAVGMNVEVWQQLSDFMKSSIDFFRRCPPSTLTAALRQAQNGFAVWSEDRQRYIFPLSNARRDGDIKSTAIDETRIVEVWADLLKLIETIPRKDSALLQSIEPLLIAGLSSPSKVIVNRTIRFWNSTFGEEDSLDYPSRIEPVLRARRAETDLQLPGLADDSTAEVAVLPAFAESQFSPRAMSDFAFSGSPRVSSDIRRKPPVDNFLIKQHLAAQGLPYDNLPKSSTRSAKRTTKSKLRHDDSQIDFAPIESSPAKSTPNETQLLTERQREVKARQHGDAQMFPDLSSSPKPQSSGRAKRVAKKLNFTPDVVRDHDGEVVAATPPAPVDGNPMSDDLPSSPTPRVETGARINHEMDNYSDNDEDDNETIVDPPSSPPQRQASPAEHRITHPDDTTVVESTALSELVSNPPQRSKKPEVDDGLEADEHPSVVTASDLPSDTQLPTVQLEREAAAAAVMADEELELDAAPEQTEDSASQTPSRIQDSIIQPVEAEGVASSTRSPARTPGSNRKDKKRKRSDEESTSKNKRGKLSPFKQFLGNLLQSQQEDEEDIGDEIIVASSRAHSSPLAKPEPEEETSNIMDSQEAEPSVPPKRKPGRPRKVETRGRPRKVMTEEGPKSNSAGRRRSSSRACSQNETATSKRSAEGKASSSSRASAEDLSGVSVVQDTPAPNKARKSARLSQGGSDAGSSQRRIMATQPEQDVAEDEHELSKLNEEMGRAEQQLAREQSAAIEGRRIAQPKSILSRLRGVLDDCKKMVFGSVEEERQFDDVLFEIRREVHEAGRRARE